MKVKRNVTFKKFCGALQFGLHSIFMHFCTNKPLRKKKTNQYFAFFSMTQTKSHDTQGDKIKLKIVVKQKIVDVFIWTGNYDGSILSKLFIRTAPSPIIRKPLKIDFNLLFSIINN